MSTNHMIDPVLMDLNSDMDSYSSDLSINVIVSLNSTPTKKNKKNKKKVHNLAASPLLQMTQ